MSSYDENLNHNKFLETLLVKHLDLIERASREEWIICIPQQNSITKQVEDEDLYEHIIDPTTGYTLNKTRVQLKDDTIVFPDATGGTNIIKVLFKEKFYHKQLKFLVYCISHLLNENSIEIVDKPIGNLRDSIDFLWMETLGREILHKINEKCETFLLTHENLLKYNLKKLINLYQGLYGQCYLLSLSKTIRKERDKIFLDKLKLAVETYILHCLNNEVFNAICANTAHSDANFNKIIQNLQEIDIKDLGIGKYGHVIPPARCELNKMDNFVTALGKLSCLKSTFQILTTNNKHNLTSDDLLQLFVFLILKVKINNWIANLILLQKFTIISRVKYDENNFLITTLEAAIEFIKSRELYEITENSSHKNLLFDSIRICDIKTIKTIFKNEAKVNNEKKICHPLCACDNCTLIFDSEDVYTTKTFDLNGRNALHIACFYGHPHIIDFFIHKGVDFNSADYSGWFPIHYAANRGNQNALLLLLHSGADLNVLNNNDNSPLHLAVNNGHENCVKALLYYSEHKSNIIKINAVNNLGNTVLHLAAKWGYLNIISLLLQYNIDINIKNKKKQYAIDLAHSCYVKYLLTNLNETQKKKLPIQEIKNNNENSQDFTCGEWETNNSYGIRPKNIDQFRRVSLLLKAIENNDLPLTCFYLNIPASPAHSTKHSSCHPLCSCENCTSGEQNTIKLKNKPKQIFNIDMCDTDGYIPLHVAAKFGRKQILRLLLDIGSNVNLQTYKTLHTPLHIACIYQHISVVKELLHCGNCNIDIRDAKGNTALHYACYRNDAKILDVLLMKGADITIKNANNKTVLQEAEDKLLYNIIKLVKSNHSVLTGKSCDLLI